MAKYTISHTCGHSSQVQLYGPERERRTVIEREEKKPCRDCEKAAWIAEHKDDAPNAVVRRIAPIAPSKWARLEIICYGNTFQHKEALKARGYKFSEYQLKGDIFAGMVAASRTGIIADHLLHGTKGWGRILQASGNDEAAGTALVEAFKAEILWLGSLGFQIIERPDFDRFYLAGSALAEGRDDLL